MNNILTAGAGWGGYVPGASVLHRTGPGPKIALALTLVAATVWGNGWVLAGVGALGVGGYALAEGSVGELGKQLRPLLGLILFLGIFPIVFTPGTPVRMLSWLPLEVTREGLQAGLFSSTRLVVMVILSAILIRTTPPNEFVRGWERPRKGRRIRTEALREISYVGVLAVQLVPHLLNQGEQWLVRQLQSRPHLRRQPLGKRVKQSTALLAPFVVDVFKNPDRVLASLRLKPGETAEAGRGDAAPEN